MVKMLRYLVTGHCSHLHFKLQFLRLATNWLQSLLCLLMEIQVNSLFRENVWRVRLYGRTALEQLRLSSSSKILEVVRVRWLASIMVTEDCMKLGFVCVDYLIWFYLLKFIQSILIIFNFIWKIFNIIILIFFIFKIVFIFSKFIF